MARVARYPSAFYRTDAPAPSATQSEPVLQLPKRSEVRIPPEKLTGYLLALGHPVGGPKARYFESRGYTIDAPHVLERSIREVATEGIVNKEEATRWGTKYVVRGVIAAPDGNPLSLDTVWIVIGGEAPILITAYPTPSRP